MTSQALYHSSSPSFSSSARWQLLKHPMPTFQPSSMALLRSFRVGWTRYSAKSCYKRIFTMSVSAIWAPKLTRLKKSMWILISPSGIRTAIRLVRPKRSGLWSIRTITCLPAFTVLHYRILVLTISFQGTLHSSLPKESSLFTLISNTLWWPKLAGENRGNRCLRLIMPADTSMALMLATTWTYSANILMRTTSICVQACGRWRYTVLCLSLASGGLVEVADLLRGASRFLACDRWLFFLGIDLFCLASGCNLMSNVYQSNSVAQVCWGLQWSTLHLTTCITWLVETWLQ